ncbi:MAG TPA: peptidylprolyl isomerase [Kiritimatiellia bacterium]|nr:peptidylprolyl isomerase [Kiritimatiellia bacterium]
MFNESIRERSMIVVAGLMTAGIMVIGCSKQPETTATPPVAPASSIASSDIFTQPIERKMPDASTVLVVVNGTEITLGEFNKEMEGMMRRMQGRVRPEQMAQMQMQMRDQLLDNLITRQVLLDTVKAQGITISSEEFDEAVEQMTDTLPPGMTMNDMLAQAGMSEEEFRKTLTMELQVRKLLESTTGGAPEITDEELQAFYTENEAQFSRDESVSASHILISTDATDSEDDKAAKLEKINDLRRQLLEGADFAELAAEHSTCPSRAQGGSLGQFERGRMVPQFETAAFSQEIGEIGEVVETQFGYHIVKVTAKNNAGAVPLEEVKEQLSQYLGNQKQQKALQTYIEGLKENANISFPGMPDAN